MCLRAVEPGHGEVQCALYCERVGDDRENSGETRGASQGAGVEGVMYGYTQQTLKTATRERRNKKHIKTLNLVENYHTTQCSQTGEVYV